MLQIGIQVLPGGLRPAKTNPTDAGYDIHARLVGPVVLLPGDRQVIPAGFILELPEGYEADIRPRSGLASKHGVTVLNTPGLIDEKYRDEIGVLLINLGQKPFTITPGDRIAQMTIERVTLSELVEKNEVDKTGDRQGGWGSSGI